ncbi:MAG: oligosaccharide flippase family protein [Christensenellales bacterium]
MKRIVKAFALVTVLSCFTRFLSFIFKIYLSRLLGAEILGVYQITFSLFSLFACLSMSGIPVTLSRLTAEETAMGNERAVGGMFSSAMILSLTICGILITVLAAFPAIPKALFSDERCVKLFYVMLPMLVTSSVYSIVRGWFWGKKEFFTFSVTELVEEIIKIAFTFAILMTGIFGITKFYSYAVAMIMSDVTMVVILFACFLFKGGRAKKPLYTRRLVKSATPLTITRLFGSLMSAFLSLAIPAMLVKYGMDTQAATAQFGRAGGMVMPILLAPTSVVSAMTVVLIPELAEQNTKDNPQGLQSKISTAIEFSWIISCMFYIIFMACGQNFVSMIYHDAQAGEFMPKVALLMIPLCVNNMAISILNSLGKEKQTFISHLISCVILAITTLIAPKYIGIYSYFLALALFHTLGMTINVILIYRQVGIDKRCATHCLGCLTFACVAGLGMSALNGLMERIMLPQISMVICAILSFVFFVAFLLGFKIVDIGGFLPKKMRR